MTDLPARLRGKFIVLDGPDGAGKSTQLAMLEEWLTGLGVPLRRTRDPGGTVIGDRIRQILLDVDHAAMAVTTEVLLYMASRAQLVAEVIAPARAAGACVLCDRFVSATIAYQGAAGARPADIAALAELVLEGQWPDLTIVLDLPADVGLSRVGRRLDRIESRDLDYHRRVREGFCAQVRAQPGRFALVDASAPPAQVQHALRAALTQWPFTTT